MSDYTMYDYVQETRNAALHILKKSETLCDSFASRYSERNYTRIWLWNVI